MIPNIQPYDLMTGIKHWATVVGTLTGVFFVLAVILVTISRVVPLLWNALLALFTGRPFPEKFGERLVEGLLAGPVNVTKGVWNGLLDFALMSPRRVWALTVLTIRESLRRKAFSVLVIFAVLMMFAGWFFAGGDDVKVYISFVFRVISWPMLILVLLLSCWGLPRDIKDRSLHTVVTKPTRKSEIVVGRLLGYSAVTTAAVALMAVVGYIWIVRQTPEDARSQLIARVPIYGTLTYLDREGNFAEKGVNVGDEWDYRGFIEGGTRSRAIWEFKNIDTRRLNDQLVIESNFEAKRMHKGDIGKTLLMQYTLINPKSGDRIDVPQTHISEFGENITTVPRQFTFYDRDTKQNRTVDLFDAAIADGNMKIEVRCLNVGQFLGMAEADLFLRTPNAPFWFAYVKGFAGTLLMLLLVILFGVTASCFTKGPVATIATCVFVLVRQLRPFQEIFERILNQKPGEEILGGGPIEATIRVYTHLNPQVPMHDHLSPTGSESVDFLIFKVVKQIDGVIIEGLRLAVNVLPDFTQFYTETRLANGFDVSWDTTLLPAVTLTLAYIIPCLLIAYYSLKNRELEAK